MAMASASKLFRKVLSPELYTNFVRKTYNNWSPFDSLLVFGGCYLFMKGEDVRAANKRMESETQMLRELREELYGVKDLDKQPAKAED